MLEYEAKEISESELELKIRDSPRLIESDLIFVDAQRRVGRGPLDLLFIDSGRALVVAELKVVRNDEMLVQALDYYDYIYSNRERLALAYEAKGIQIDASQEPRIILIAPDYSQLLVNRCKWLDINIDLYRYRYLIVEKDGEVIGDLLDFISVEIPSIPEPEEVWTEKKVLDFITSKQISKTALKFLETLKTWDNVRIDPIKQALSMKINSNVFAYFYPLRSGFNVDGYLKGKDWYSLATVRNSEDLEDAFVEAKKAYDNIKEIKG